MQCQLCLDKGYPSETVENYFNIKELREHIGKMHTVREMIDFICEIAYYEK